MNLDADRRQINQAVRRARVTAGQSDPGIVEQRARIAVYSVATGERLGMALESLIRLRLLAELAPLRSIDPELAEMMAADDMSRSIVRLCEAFDACRMRKDLAPQDSDAEAVAWLQRQAAAQFDRGIVEALLAVQSIIQPVGS